MLNRRQFLALLASGVAAETLVPLCEPALRAELQDEQVHLKKRFVQTNKSYGSGAFGEWATDLNGLPCYQYTCDQRQEPTAIVPVETAWRAPTVHTHQIGNDRITAAASNYGYLQVRQDEGGAKFLNDYKPDEGFFGAGIGYLTDGEEVLGTYFPGTGTVFDRTFGVGYLRKQITGVNFSVDQLLYAPFGDDPVLISEVTISSQSHQDNNLIWAEYWGCQIYPFSYRAFRDAHTGDRVDGDAVTAARRELAGRFAHSFQLAASGKALLESKQLQSRPLPQAGIAVQEEVADDPALFAHAEAAPSHPSGEPEEIVPPSTFLATLDDGPVRFETNTAKFFGEFDTVSHIGPAGPQSVPVAVRLLHPAGFVQRLPASVKTQKMAASDLSATGPESALILEKPFTLEAGGSQTFRFLYGYLPDGFTAEQLIGKYRSAAPKLFAESSAAWREQGIRFEVKDDPWVARETAWHSYYLRSGLSYDDRFGEHILSQGQVYQYCMGYQGSARDPLQHALPLIFTAPGRAREILRYALKSQRHDGSLPYAISGHGEPIQPATPSDFDLWLLWLASEYVLATRDAAILEENLQSPIGGPGSTIRSRLAQSYQHLVHTVGAGKHGLLRGLDADWNEVIYRQSAPSLPVDQLRLESESVSNSAMAAYVLDHYARMLRFAPGSYGPAPAEEAAAEAAVQRTAVRGQWAGKWFRRLWLGDAGGWVGDDRLWLEAQPWALLGQCSTADQRETLIRSMDELCRKPSRIGVQQLGSPNGSKPLDWPGFRPGESKNGGVYAELGGLLIWALAQSDPAMAWDEWQKNSRARHAEVYRDLWYGIWSGPDVYCSSDSEHAGQTGYDWGLVSAEARHLPSIYRGLSWTAWPVMNMHRHAWPLYSAAKLLGIEFTEKGLDLAPTLPKGEFSFRSGLVSIEKNEAGYQGSYTPAQPGSWTLRLKLPPDTQSLYKKLRVNQVEQALIPESKDIIRFMGNSSPEEPLQWSLTRA